MTLAWKRRQPYGGIPLSSAHALGLVPHQARPRQYKTMLTAKASGKVCVEGEWIDIRAGRDRVEAGHAIIKAAPHLFGLEAAPVKTTSRRSSDEVELRTSSESPIAVVLDEGARTRIVNEVLEWASDYRGEDRESGGYLFGRRLNSKNHTLGPREPDVLEVTLAAYGGEGTQRRSGSMRHDVDYGLAFEHTLRRRGGRERLVGDYHSHPDGGGIPSPGDLRGWLRSFQLLGVQSDYNPQWLLGDGVTPNCYVGMIVTRSAGGSWIWPQLHVWITREEDGRVVCEPVAI